MSSQKETVKIVYNVYFYEGKRDTVVVTDSAGKELAIECKKAEEQVQFDAIVDAGYLERLTREESVNYVSFAMRLGGLQDYVDV